jgi:GNAT superfamily N-acetyltransferase
MIVTIRKATAADLEPVRSMVVAAYEGYIPRVGAKPGPMRADYDALIRAGQVWLAEEDGAPVGLLVLAPQPDHLLLENIAVTPAAQGRGIGTRLMGFVEDEARRLGLAEIRLYTHVTMTENIAYYGRRGYVETHRATDQGFTRVFFRKSVNPTLTNGRSST